MLRHCLFILLIFMVKKSSFMKVNSSCYSFKGEEVKDVSATFIYESLYCGIHEKKAVRYQSQLAIQMLLLLSGDVEVYPGPTDRFIPELEQISKLRGFHLLHQNVRGLLGNKDYIIDILEYIRNIQILSLSETHIKQDLDYGGIFDIPGYQFIHRPRKTGGGGGVGAYIKDGVNWKRRQDLECYEIECIFVEILPPKSKSFLILIMYRPPDTSKYLHRDFNKMFCELLLHVGEKELIITGDLNVNFLKRNDNKEIKSLLTSYGFTQLIKEPTRIDGDTQSLIDIILTNNVSNIRQTAVIPTSIGDHDMIGCVRKINYVKFPSKKIIARNYRNYDPEKLNEHLLSHNWDELYELNDVNLSWNFIKNILSNAFDMFAPKIVKQVRGKTSPWLNPNIKKLMNKRDQLLRKSRKSRNTFYRDEYKRKRNESK